MEKVIQAVAQYLLSLTNGWLPEAINERLTFLAAPEQYLTHTLAQKAIESESGVASLSLGPDWLPLQSFFMFTKRRQMIEVSDYGTSEHTVDDPESRKLYHKLSVMLGNEPIVVHGGELAREERAELRQFIFPKEAIDEVSQETVRCINNMLANWDKGQSINQQVSFAILQAIGKCFMGVDYLPDVIVGTLARAEIAVTFEEPSSLYFQQVKDDLEIISAAVMKNNPNFETKNSYLSYMFKKMGLSDAASLNPAAGLMLTNNIAFLITGAILQVAQNKTIYQKLNDEIKDVDLQNITEQDLSKYHYVTALYQESLRFYSPTSMIARYASKEAVLDEVEVPAGSFLFVPIARIHHAAQNYENPDVFNPDRFLDAKQEVVGSTNNEKLCPFSLGYRSCPASHAYTKRVFFAAMATFFSQVKLELDHDIEQLDFFGKLIRFKEKYYAKAMLNAYTAKDAARIEEIEPHIDAHANLDGLREKASASPS